MERSRTKKFVTIAATFGFALAIGFVMQNGDVLASRLGVDGEGTPPASADIYTPVSATGFVQPRVRVDAVTGSVTEVTDGAFDPFGSSMPNMSFPTSEDGAALGCEIAFDAAPAKAAMVTLSLKAPCHAETLVTVQHQGMKFHDMTDSKGELFVDVPALAKEAFFVATIDETEGVAALTGVPDLDLYDRAVLQWQGDEKLQLHASEFGADANTTGHVWAASANVPETSVTGTHGFMTPLGTSQSTAPLMVQVYTFPTGMSARNGDVVLSVQAEVTPANCGRSVIAQSIQLRPFQPPAARRITMKVPACDKVGEILVLKNMFEDLTLAAK